MEISGCSFLADENIAPRFVATIRQQASMESVRDRGLTSRSDKEILHHAFENGLVVVTQDSDFGKLIFADREPFLGIVYLKPGHVSSTALIQSFQALLESQVHVEPPFMVTATWSDGDIEFRVRNALLMP